MSASTKAATFWEKWGVMTITGATVLSMGVWWRRKVAQDPELRSPDSRAAGMPQHPEGGVEQGYGRKVAEAAGMMEGNRAMQGICPTKKITDALEGTPLLPSSKDDAPSKDPILKQGKH